MEAIGTYEQVDIGVITPSTTNPRKHYDDASMADLTASVRQAGVQSPILLRPRIKHLGSFEIVCGERRWRAAKAAGLETIPAIVRELDDEDAYQAQIIENLQREDLGPMEEAESYGIIARSGSSVVDIASKVGKAGAYVAQRIQLLKLISKAQASLRKGDLLLGHALEIAKLNEDQQEQALEHCLDRWDNPTLPQLKEFIQRTFLLDLSKAPFSIKDTGMHPEAGACVDCSKRTGADQLLFNDVKQGDSCLDPKCYRVKVQTIIHVRIEELKKKQDVVPLLSNSYTVDKKDPSGTLGCSSYEKVTASEPCEYVSWGVMIHGQDTGKKVKICLEKTCKVHHRFSGGSSPADAEKRKKQAAKDRRDTEVRFRTASAIARNVMSSTLLNDDVNLDDALDLAEYAFHRMDHAQDARLAKVLGWERDYLGHRSKDRGDILAGIGTRQAMSLAVLATVAGDLTVQHTYGSGKPEGLNKLAERHGVDVEAIGAMVDAELKSKSDKKKTAKDTSATKPKAAKAVKGQKSKRKTLSPEQRKRIAAAIQKRWSGARKKGA